jgi:hypothetical protein
MNTYSIRFNGDTDTQTRDMDLAEAVDWIAYQMDRYEVVVQGMCYVDRARLLVDMAARYGSDEGVFDRLGSAYFPNPQLRVEVTAKASS